ncbi:hypothetical protein DSL72_005085 [Monilinia vaccinii-corymbosi]|uniref:Rhodopsin domain-containing protein n=1 Tax=Monilinia vaccinii-corymbosi TaxID=61207 RepID=A0A8A3PE83_9HELO|nr:hypothetical protein DSL72_005085 [Monilinia vaccinii-corymbosi]
MQDYWRVTQGPQPNCINQSSTLLTAGIINTITEFLVVLLPYSTNLPRHQQFLVSLLFVLGLLSCFAGIVRTYYMYVVTQVWDQVWASYPVWVCAAVELYIGIICTSIPATKPFFVTYIPSFFNAHLSRTPRNSFDHHPSYNPYFNFKGDPIPYPGFGVISTSKSHAVAPPGEAPTAPTSGHLSAENSLPDRTAGTFLDIASRSSTPNSSNEKNDEKMGVDNAAGYPLSLSFDSRSSSSPHGPSNLPSSSSTPRGTTGPVAHQRGRTRDRDDGYREFPSTASSAERKQRPHPAEERQETDGGWDIHIGIVKTIVFEEEHINKGKK